MSGALGCGPTSVELDTLDEIATITALSESKLGSLAGRIASVCEPGDVLCLFGDLGVGKTSFARAFIRSLANQEQEVPSPTFTLAQLYEISESLNSFTIWHVDLYRLSDAEEIWELGLEDAFAEAIVLIEWPERALEYMPAKRLELYLGFCDKSMGRSVVLKGVTRWADRLRGLLKTRAS